MQPARWALRGTTASPSLPEGPRSRPCPAGLPCSPSRDSDRDCHPRLEPGPHRALQEQLRDHPPPVGALLRGPVPLRPLCRVPASFRTACLTAYTALLRSLVGVQPPPLCLLEVEPGHLHFRYCPEDLEVTAPRFPPAPRPPEPHQQAIPPGSSPPSDPRKENLQAGWPL